MRFLRFCGLRNCDKKIKSLLGAIYTRGGGGEEKKEIEIKAKRGELESLQPKPGMLVWFK